MVDTIIEDAVQKLAGTEQIQNASKELTKEEQIQKSSEVVFQATKDILRKYGVKEEERAGVSKVNTVRREKVVVDSREVEVVVRSDEDIETASWIMIETEGLKPFAISRLINNGKPKYVDNIDLEEVRRNLDMISKIGPMIEARETAGKLKALESQQLQAETAVGDLADQQTKPSMTQRLLSMAKLVFKGNRRSNNATRDLPTPVKSNQPLPEV